MGWCVTCGARSSGGGWYGGGGVRRGPPCNTHPRSQNNTPHNHKNNYFLCVFQMLSRFIEYLFQPTTYHNHKSRALCNVTFQNVKLNRNAEDGTIRRKHSHSIKKIFNLNTIHVQMYRRLRNALSQMLNKFKRKVKGAVTQ